MAIDLKPDTSAARRLGALLRDLDYSEDTVSDLLDDDAYSGDPEDLAVHARRLPETKLGIALRALFLGLPVTREEAARALGKEGLEALEATGLAEVGAQVVPQARILP